MPRSLALSPLLLGLSLAAVFGSLAAQSPAPEQPYTPTISPASDEGVKAIRRFRVPEGLQVDLFAAEPMLANPVAFCTDEKGRFYVAETFRHHAGVTDARGHMYWLDDDLACRTVADRVAMLKKHLRDKAADYAREHDRVRLVEDRDGDGKADQASVFADGFKNIPDGIGAGVLARNGKVWYTCIPDLWLLTDNDGDGKADERKSLHHGYGVHVGYLGHDLHGLRFGPDGKLYFTIGDRGFNIKTEGRTLAYPDTGAVLRCNPDGSELEVVATGLRNPQELAFDQFGNLFTCDNNSDSGDQARWVYVVEGGDSGWRIGYQFINVPNSRGPWNAEKLWHANIPAGDGPAAYLVPPLANLSDGPSGLTYHPGTSLLPDKYKDHFFLADFRGGSGNSGVRSFAVKPKGASFEVIDSQQFVWSILATDVDFGPDGGLYISDWVEGWNKPTRGRIYKVYDPARLNDPVVQEVKKLLAEAMSRRPIPELAKLLEHRDQRVRQEAQFALAEKAIPLTPSPSPTEGRGEGIGALAEVAKKSDKQLGRLHAIWGLAQIGRKKPAALEPVVELLTDRDAEVRAQAAKVLGDGRVAAAYDKLVALLEDPEPRVRFFAAMSLGKLGRREAVKPILQMLRTNADKDAYLRHAGVMALVGSKDLEGLLAAAKDESPSVRLAVLLALRRLESPEVVRFLKDADAKLVLEAARAINDVPISDALPELAALSRRKELPDALGFRVVNANFRLGKAEHATALAAIAGRSDVSENVRVEALRALGDWAKPSGRDRVVGLWRPLEPRSASVAVEALRPTLAGILSGPNQVREQGIQLAAKLGIKEVGPALVDLLADPKSAPKTRAEALKALEALKHERLPEALKVAVTDPDPQVRTEGRRLLAKLKPAEAIPELESALERGSVAEQQGALATLGDVKLPEADAVLVRWLDKLLAGKVPLEIQLELLEAAARRSAPDIKEKLTRYEASRPKNDPLAPYREALAGGDAETGRNLFIHKAETTCQRCHKINGEGGEVGPDLSKIGAQQKRDYLLEAIVDPNKQIAKGFDTIVLTTLKGDVVFGILKEEDGNQVTLIAPDGKPVTVPKSQIDERGTGKSAMPEDLIKHLSKSELRDLVEFLAGLK